MSVTTTGRSAVAKVFDEVVEHRDKPPAVLSKLRSNTQKRKNKEGERRKNYVRLTVKRKRLGAVMMRLQCSESCVSDDVL